MAAHPPWNTTERFRFRGACADRASYEEVQEFLAAHQTSIPHQVWDHSHEGRLIPRVDLGDGPQRIAIWTQMHGDEPTHTVVMLELLRTLAHDPPPWAQTVLEKCQISVLLMLNPDGAIRWTRRNAQDIDINRDARRLATREGRALKRMIDEGAFDFGLNLHNQNPRRTITPGNSAACSLLVPPRDAENSRSPAVDRAQRWAGGIAAAVAAKHPQVISRYNADYMPRCFGEWVQSQDVSTLLIEAGGFAGHDVDWLLTLHYGILCQALWDVATAGMDKASPDNYLKLPRSHDEDNFDFVIQGGRLGQEASKCDLGINCCDTRMGPASKGQIAEIGDIGKPGLHQFLSADGLSIAAGKTAVWSINNARPLDDAAFLQMAQAGVTTVLLSIPLADTDALKCESDHWSASAHRLNVGLVGELPQSQWPDSTPTVIDAVKRIGVAGFLQRGGLPSDALDFEISAPILHLTGDVHQHEFAVLEQFSLPQREGIRIGQIADLVLLDPSGNVRHVVLGGKLAFSDGEWHSPAAGTFIHGGRNGCGNSSLEA